MELRARAHSYHDARAQTFADARAHVIADPRALRGEPALRARATARAQALRCLMPLALIEDTLYLLEEPELQRHPGSITSSLKAFCLEPKSLSVIKCEVAFLCQGTRWVTLAAKEEASWSERAESGWVPWRKEHW